MKRRFGIEVALELGLLGIVVRCRVYSLFLVGVIRFGIDLRCCRFAFRIAAASPIGSCVCNRPVPFRRLSRGAML